MASNNRQNTVEKKKILKWQKPKINEVCIVLVIRFSKKLALELSEGKQNDELENTISEELIKELKDISDFNGQSFYFSVDC